MPGACEQFANRNPDSIGRHRIAWPPPRLDLGPSDLDGRLGPASLHARDGTADRRVPGRSVVRGRPAGGAGVDVSSTVIRWTGHGLVRKPTKSKAGERSLLIPSWMVTELQLRRSQGVRMDEPVFATRLAGSETHRTLAVTFAVPWTGLTSAGSPRTVAAVRQQRRSLTKPGSPHASSLISWVMQGLR